MSILAPVQNDDSPCQLVTTVDSAAKEETGEPDHASDKVKIEPPNLLLSLVTPPAFSRKRSLSPRASIFMQSWAVKKFRYKNGEPASKRLKVAVNVLVQEFERFRISTARKKKKELTATLCYDASDVRALQVTVDEWRPQGAFITGSVDNQQFADNLKKERLSSVCSYHNIDAKKDYFHCIWQVDNPWKSDFFKNLPRRTRQQVNGSSAADITIPGPVFNGPMGTSWQAVAYPYGYRSNRREGLVAMAVRYNNGPEAHVSAGFQISLLSPANFNHRGLQDVMKDHCDRLQESSKRSNVFKRGKKGWVLRKFATRAQLKEHKRSTLIFVFSFCLYGRAQTQYRHRFSKDTKEAETNMTTFVKRLWNNGTPSGKIRMEAKAGKTFRVHSSVLQLNGQVLDCIASSYAPETRRSINFPELTEAVLRKMLEYCYTLQVTRLDRTPFELLIGAHRYGLSGLQGFAEREIAKHIDGSNVIDLYLWNESLQSEFLAAFITMYLSTNYLEVRNSADSESKLSDAQKALLDQQHFHPVEASRGNSSETMSGELSENSHDEFDGDSGVEDSFADDDEEHFRFQDDETDDAMTDDISDGERVPAPAVGIGEEPEEPNQAAVAAPGQLALDQQALFANMLQGDIDEDAINFVLMLM